MAFKLWNFNWNPPKTVPAPVPDSTLVAESAAGATAPVSQAARLIGTLEELKKTSDYLQAVILARSAGMGVSLDPATEPDVARALEVLYGVEETPKFVTVEMYNRTLDAEMAGLIAEMALPLDSPYEVNPFQIAAASTVNRFVEAGLVEDGTFVHALPLLLKDLKGDAVLFDALQQELAKYPAATLRTAEKAVPRAGAPTSPIQARTLDVSLPLASYLDGYLGDFAGVYASVYRLAATVGHVEAEVEAIVNAYFMQPVEDIIRLIALFEHLKGAVHVPRLKDIVNGLTGFVLVRLAAEAGALRFQIDRFMNLAITPLKQMTGTVGQALGMVQRIAIQATRLQNALGGVKDGFRHQDGALKGMSYSYDCGLPHNADKPKPLKGLAGIDKAGNAVNKVFAGLDRVEYTPGATFDQMTSRALTSLASHIKWGLESTETRNAMTDEAFRKMNARRLGDHAAELDLMCSLQALDSFLNLLRAVLNVQQMGGLAARNAQATGLEAVGRILASAGTGNSYVMQDGQIQAIPPEVPPVPTDVQPVLRRGGLDAIPA